MANSLPVAVFGVGEGGSSFVVMNYFNSPFEYAYSPNIGAIRLVVENGFLGALLFFVAYGRLTKRALLMCRADTSGYRRLFLTTSMAAMCLEMTGSGISLGIPLAVAAMYAAQARGSDFKACAG